MKFKIAITLLLLICFSFAAKAQTEEYNLDSIDVANAVTPVLETKPPYAAIGGGYTANFFMANFDDFNQHLTDLNFGVGKFDGAIFMSGGQGFIPLWFVPNLRVGFFGMAGNKSIEAPANDVNCINCTRTVEFSNSMAGISFDYGFIPFKHIAILPGVNFGWGTLSLSTYQTTGDVDWSEFKPSASNSFYNKAQASYLLIQPSLNIEWSLTPVTVLRLGASYNLSMMGDWKLNNASKINNMPDGINGSGLNFQLGVFVGVFAY